MSLTPGEVTKAQPEDSTVDVMPGKKILTGRLACAACTGAAVFYHSQVAPLLRKILERVAVLHC